MSKRKKKHNRHEYYQRKFEVADIIWLANEYSRRSKSEPSLKLEDFSIQYGILADELRAYIPGLDKRFSNSVILWHGTSKKRAESIMKQGFRAKRTGIFFTKEPAVARDYAEKRAKNESDEPAVIMCSIDLDHYVEYERRGNVFVFSTDCIGNEVVKQITGRKKQRHEKAENRTISNDSIKVSLTFSSNRAAIAYWINIYLNGTDEISEDHEVVVRLKQWLDEQVDAGRFGEVANDEIIEQVQKHGLLA